MLLRISFLSRTVISRGLRDLFEIFSRFLRELRLVHLSKAVSKDGTSQASGNEDGTELQGTDNVVPTGCRMPELAAEKLT